MCVCPSPSCRPDGDAHTRARPFPGRRVDSPSPKRLARMLRRRARPGWRCPVAPNKWLTNEVYATHSGMSRLRPAYPHDHGLALGRLLHSAGLPMPWLCPITPPPACRPQAMPLPPCTRPPCSPRGTDGSAPSSSWSSRGPRRTRRAAPLGSSENWKGVLDNPSVWVILMGGGSAPGPRTSCLSPRRRLPPFSLYGVITGLTSGRIRVGHIHDTVRWA